MIVSPISKCAGCFSFCSLWCWGWNSRPWACRQVLCHRTITLFPLYFETGLSFPSWLSTLSLWNTGPAFFSDPPGSASWAARITDLHHQVQLQNGSEILAWLFLSLKWKSYSIFLKTFISFLRIPYNVFCSYSPPFPISPYIYPCLPHPSNFMSFFFFLPIKTNL